ncbi:MAG: hypothetical protein ABIG68_12170, partial [Acidobacteriota bacterium]
MIRAVHRARYVIPESGLLLDNGCVHVLETGRIARVQPWHEASPAAGARVVDWGDSLLLPGLVNAHAHLELT